MYTEYFGLKEKPFSIAPNPRYLYMSEQHQDALAHLLYGIQEGEGFVLLTGDIGTGKTTICRCLLEQIPDHVEVAYIFNPKLSAQELLLSICDEFRIPLGQGNVDLSTKQAIDKINGHLLKLHRNNRHCVLIIDEAQNLSVDVLEQIRLLTNLETNSKKLLQIILIGQPELRIAFQKPELEQLAQRITARFHIGPLSLPELENYLQHRIHVAGGSKRPLFNKSAIKTLHKLTRGIPRLINTVSDRALLATYVSTQNQVTKKEIQTAAREILNAPLPSRTFPSLHGKMRIFGFTLAATVAIALISFFIAPKLKLHEGGSNTITPQIAEHNSVNSNARSVPLSGTLQRPLSIHETRSPAHNTPEVTDQSVQTAPATPLVSNTAFSELETISIEQLTLAARQTLLARWNIDTQLKLSDDFCLIAQHHSLRCFQGKQSLEYLIKLNRPAVIRLVNSNGEPYVAAINKVAQQEAQLFVSGNNQLISLERLESAWTGDFELLWRPPFQYSKAIDANSSAQSIQWFRETLNIASSKPSSNIPIFIAPIDKQIRLFQKEAGLEPDGLAGPETIITINNLNGSSSPLLTDQSETN
ncbi:MAG: AAA family ATPase [Gammaproteobacteria bacterium]|nr:AAA family ATPase [Gammaproteobacteria bacterium]